MNMFVNSVMNKGLTNNGAITNLTSESGLIDFMFLAGAARNFTDDEYEYLFSKAIREDDMSAIKLFFWAGDIREGLGERKLFKQALKYLAIARRRYFVRAIKFIPQYSRWDVLFDFYEYEEVMDFLVSSYNSEENLLLYKWLPRESSNKHVEFRKAFIKALGVSPKDYRKKVARLTKVVEQQMSSKQWSDIKYSSVPSVAFKKYAKAFGRNDATRFGEFIQSSIEGKTSIKAGAIHPVEIVKANNSWDVKQAQWNNLPNFLGDGNYRMLPVCDVSGSMSGTPMEISVSLGLYLSERLTGAFKDMMCTFTSTPKFVKLTGNLQNRYRQVMSDVGYDTNLRLVFTTMLDIAVANKVPAEDMPNKILVISDMEFNNPNVKGLTNLQAIRKDYEVAGYELPVLVFWNVNGRLNNVPATTADSNVILISGSSPSILKYVLDSGCDSKNSLKSILNSDRYMVLEGIK